MPRKDKAPVEEKLKIEILDDGTIVHDVHLVAGDVIELTASDIDLHRDHGLRFGPVADDDTREVVPVSPPPEPEPA